MKNRNTRKLSAAAAAAKSLQSCLTLCDPIDGSPPGFPVPGILQARTLACHFSDPVPCILRAPHSVAGSGAEVLTLNLYFKWDFLSPLDCLYYITS